MSEELKEFFNKIKDSQDYDLLLNLYNNPSSVIGNKQDMDEAEEEYYNLDDYFRLMMNNNLTEFIKLALHDDNFLGKADTQTFRKLNFFLYESVDFKKYYHILDDPDTLSVLSDEISIQEYFRRKGNYRPEFSLMEMKKAYQKYEKLFAYGYPKEQIDNYDEKDAKNIREYVYLTSKSIEETQLKKKLFR